MEIDATSKVFAASLDAYNRGVRYIVNQGGTSSGKTWGILTLLWWIAQYKKNLLISIVSETMPHLKRGVIRDFMRILDDRYSDNNHNKSDNVYTIPETNSQIEFFSADQSDKVRGPRRSILFINEANNVQYSAFEQLEIRTEGSIFVDFNPVCEFWAHELIKKSNAAFIKSTYLDNPHVPKQVVESIESRRDTDPNFWRVYGMGEIGSLEGLVYPAFGLVDEIPLGGRRVTGMDFGYSNDPTAVVDVCIHDRSIYFDERVYETGLTNQDIDTRLGMIYSKDENVIIADCAEPKSIEEIHRCGWIIYPSEKGKDSVRGGIQSIKAYHIKVTKRSINLIKELRNYLWMKNKEEKMLPKPIDNWNHALDAARYAAMYIINGMKESMFVIGATVSGGEQNTEVVF